MEKPRENHQDDVLKLFETIRDLWPDLKITVKDISHPTSDFLLRFFKSFVADLNEKMSYIMGMGEECSLGEFIDKRLNFTENVLIICEISSLFVYVNDTFSNIRPYLMDLNDPFPRKIFPFMKVCVHMIIFIDKSIDDIYSLANSVLKQRVERENLELLKQQVLKENADIAEKIAKAKAEQENLNIRLLEVQKKHSEMLLIKSQKLVKRNEEAKLIESLQKREENIDHLLGNLEKEELDLQEQIVTDERFAELKATVLDLELEAGNIKELENDFQDALGDEKDAVNFLQDCATELEKIDYTSLNVQEKFGMAHVLEELNKENSMKKESLQLYTNKIKNSTISKNVMKKYLEDLTEELSVKKANITKKTRDVEICLANFGKRVAHSAKEFDMHKSTIKQRQQEIRETHFNINLLHEEFNTCYSEMLKADRECDTNFKNYLQAVIQKYKN